MIGFVVLIVLTAIYCIGGMYLDRTYPGWWQQPEPGSMDRRWLDQLKERMTR